MLDDCNGLQWTGFLAESQMFAFNALRIVYPMEKTPIIYCITHLLLMTLHLECLPYRTLSYSDYQCTDIFSKSYFIWSTICGSNFMYSKKVSWLRQRVTNAQLSLVYTSTTNRPCASQICIGILSIKTQSLCDILIGWQLNEIKPAAIGQLGFYDKPWGIGLVAIFWSFVVEAKFGLPLSSSGVLRSLRRASRK